VIVCMTLTTAAHNITNAKKQTDSFSYLVAILRNFFILWKKRSTTFLFLYASNENRCLCKAFTLSGEFNTTPQFCKTFRKSCVLYALSASIITSFKSICRANSIDGLESWIFPGVKSRETTHTLSFTIAWIFVFRPPREIPISCLVSYPFASFLAPVPSWWTLQEVISIERVALFFWIWTDFSNMALNMPLSTHARNNL